MNIPNTLKFIKKNYPYFYEEVHIDGTSCHTDLHYRDKEIMLQWKINGPGMAFWWGDIENGKPLWVGLERKEFYQKIEDENKKLELYYRLKNSLPNKNGKPCYQSKV